MDSDGQYGHMHSLINIRLPLCRETPVLFHWTLYALSKHSSTQTMTDSASTPPMWGFTAGWFTSASLFLLLNLVIGTIVLTSRFSSNRRHQEQEQLRPIARAPSLLERVKSFDLSFYNYLPLHPEATADSVPDAEPEYKPGVQLERTPSFLERMKSIKLSSFYRSEPETEFAAEPESESHDTSQGHATGVEVEHQVKRSKSEPRVGAERRETEKMKKSASEREVAVEEDREDVERRRPATTRLEKTESFGDEAVDAKADDFINRFKQQLKLQRLDSLLRYRDMLKGK